MRPCPPPPAMPEEGTEAPPEVRSSRERWRKEVQEALGEASGDPSKDLPLLGEPREDEESRYLEKIGFPGQFPFTRGIHPTQYRGRLWTMRQYSGFGTAEETNRRFRALLSQGQTGLSVAFDLPTQIGYDPDHPRAHGEVGRCGVSISHVEDMEVLFRGLPLDRATVSMTINATATILLGLLVVVGERHGIPRARLGGTVQNDILKEYAARGTYIFPPSASMRLTVDLIEFGTREMPQWNTISVSGYHMREAGATAAQEVAFTLADGLAYAQAVRARGLPVDDFLPRVSFFFSADRNFLEEIAKFRAARRLWAELTRDVLGARSARAQQLRFHTQTAGSSLTAQQPELNVIRTTLEALSAVLGGTQSLHTNALDEALGLPTEASARLALRTQQILAEESGVTLTVDPVGGAWAIEDLTDRIEEEARRYLSEIDRRGGALKAVEQGYYQEEISREAYRVARDREDGRERVVGVNSHLETEEGFSLFPIRGRRAGLEILRVPPSLERKAAQRVRALRERRRRAAWTRAMDALTRGTESGDNVMPLVIEALKARATLGEIAGEWRRIFGEYQPPHLF
jgi:methylmalonyl-CoA mutase N-terminal domain/subunit